ncbi:hypothetical protein EGC86_10800 [Shewanella frigidimarina]|nr:hypothetical protein EGC86_10800 [Shewanella frigidimarina]
MTIPTATQSKYIESHPQQHKYKMIFINTLHLYFTSIFFKMIYQKNLSEKFDKTIDLEVFNE